MRLGIRIIIFIIILAAPVWVIKAQNSACVPKGETRSYMTCNGIICCLGAICEEFKEFKVIGSHDSLVTSAQCIEDTDTNREQVEDVAKPIEFNPQVTVPGSIKIGDKEFFIKKGTGVVVDNQFFAKYLALFYKFFILAIAVVAVVMIMWGGFKRIMAFGSEQQIASANETITGSLIGLVLVLGAYTLLHLINPALVAFEPLVIEDIKRVDFEFVTKEEQSDISAQSVGTYVEAVGTNIINGGRYKVEMSVLESLREVAKKLEPIGVQLVVASGLRDVEDQKKVIAENCKNPPGSETCDPKPGKASACILKNGPTSCPHTTGRAVDVWAATADKQVISKQKCLQDKNACAEVSGMKQLIAAMREAGFCKLCSEPWHFEKPKMSPCCN